MIARLEGRIWEIEGNKLVVDCNGVGYAVTVSTTVLATAAENAPISLYIREIVREDLRSLYGFSSAQERAVFDLLRDVKGCGPKIAQTALSFLGTDELIRAISLEDATALAKTPGIGPKLAERIVLELKEPIREYSWMTQISGSRDDKTEPIPQDELVEALIALGYRKHEIEQAAKAAREESESLPDQIRIALGKLR